MVRVTVLNVGHGLCIDVEEQSGERMVFDCGTHERRNVSPAWKILAKALAQGDMANVFAVSHLHYDHYSGFLGHLSNVARDVRVVLPRLPEIVGSGDLGERLAACLLAFDPLGGQYGPREVDLLRRIRQYAPSADPKPVSTGDTVHAAAGPWDVLWPPQRVTLGERGMKKFETAIQSYEAAAAEFPALSERLVAVRDSDLFKELLNHGPRRLDAPVVELNDDDLDDSDDEVDGGQVQQGGGLLDAASKALGAAANS